MRHQGKRLTSPSKSDHVDDDASNIRSIRAEVDAVSVPVPPVPARIVQIRHAVMASPNEVVLRNLGESDISAQRLW